MRVWKLAETLGIASKTLLEIARANGVEIPNHLCSLEPEAEAKLRELVQPQAEAQVTPQAEPTSQPDETRQAGEKPPQNAVVVPPPDLSPEKNETPTPAEEGKAPIEIKPQPPEEATSEIIEPAVPVGEIAGKIPGEQHLAIKQEIIEIKPEVEVATIAATAHGTLQREKEAPKEERQQQVKAYYKKDYEKKQGKNTPQVTSFPRKAEATTWKNRTVTGGRKSYQDRRPLPQDKIPKYPKNRQLQKEVVPARKIDVKVPISVKELSQTIGVRATDIVEKLLKHFKVMANLNQSLDETMVEWIALEFGKDVQINKGENIEETILKELEKEDSPAELVSRAPVVTFMGHVDHGKTSLLDKIRKTNVALQEAGGITQHIGAYKIKTDKQEVVFLDTPGHEAFTAMRARGANVTDIVVLVVAADDGVMPQTVEAINHAKAAEVPIVVALNKIDKATAKPEAVMQQLCQHQLIPEKWQGDTGCIEVSALTGQGVPELLEYLGLMAEMLELKGNPKRKASGVVLESKVVEGKGVVSTLLVQNGILRCGDIVLSGTSDGRIRDMLDDAGNKIQAAGPATPVEVSGLSELPDAGERFYVLDKLPMARAIAEERKAKLREKSLQKGARKISLAEIMQQIQQGDIQELRIVLKTDVHGSLEALTPKLMEIGNAEIKLKILHAAVGGINEGDIQLAIASRGVIVGFNVTASRMAREMAEEKGIEIRYYNVIYHLLEDVKKIMSGLLMPEDREEITGHASIRKVIRTSKAGNVAGCFVTDGHIDRTSKIRIARNGVILNKEKSLVITSLRRFKEDVGKVKAGFECGIKLDGFEDIKEGDEFEAFKIIQVEKTLA